jgi:hypothetical protein
MVVIAAGSNLFIRIYKKIVSACYGANLNFSLNGKFNLERKRQCTPGDGAVANSGNRRSMYLPLVSQRHS